MKERGGLKTLILDDPQELLDSENRRRLADSFEALVDSGAQLVVTSYDRRFAAAVVRVPGVSSVDHRSVHPATANSRYSHGTPPGRNSGPQGAL
jgi:DNA repair exonuclease SbcCD ATPase subunit